MATNKNTSLDPLRAKTNVHNNESRWTRLHTFGYLILVSGPLLLEMNASENRFKFGTLKCSRSAKKHN